LRRPSKRIIVPNQHHPDKRNMTFWVTEEERKAIKKDMRKLGIKTYTDYILYKLGMEREEDDDK
jgi:hypothetical protein